MNGQASEWWQSCEPDQVLSDACSCGVAPCEIWCESVNPCVRYANDAVAHPGHLSMADRIILHALGVEWGPGKKRRKRQVAR